MNLVVSALTMFNSYPATTLIGTYTTVRSLAPSSRKQSALYRRLRPAGSRRRSRGKGFKRHPLPLAHPHPGLKSGTFYFAEKRNFLLCLDSDISRVDL
jgi:hypothetical protein